MKVQRLLLFLFAIVFLDISAWGYHGRVFLDENNNKMWDGGEKGLSGVMVSDGLNVVTTSRDGSYSLPGHAKAKFIFITTPSGFRTNGMFYHPISSEMTSYDFPLQADKRNIGKDGSHLFIHISDTEINKDSTAKHSEWVQNIRDYAMNEGAAFIMHTGDICYENGLKNHIGMMNALTMDTPMFYCVGNHDLVKGTFGEEMYERYYGPVCYSFNVGRVHYIVTPRLRGDYQPSYTKEDVYRWLRNDLEQLPEGTPVVMFSHDLSVTGNSFVLGINEHDFIDLDACHLKAWIYGHWHINHIHKHKSALSICTASPVGGGIDHSSAAFRVIRVDKQGNITSELRYPYINKSLEIASIDNLQAPVLESGKVPISVNAYSTISPVVSLSYDCIYESEKKIMNRPLKQYTNFNWCAELSLPQRLKGELVTVSVKAVLKNGEIMQARKSFIYCPVSSTISVKENWSNFLQTPQHRGVITDSLVTPLRLSWIQNVGSNIFMTSPVVYNGDVFIASMDENATGKSAIVSINARTGNINWKYPVSHSIKNSIAACEDLLLAQDVEGYLSAIHVRTGELAWRRKLNVKETLPALIEGLVAENGIVYAGSGEGLCAIKLEDGTELWRNRAWRQNHGSTATISVGKNVLIASSHWGELFAHNATDGKLLWRVSKDGIRHRSSSAVMDKSVLYLLSDKSLFIVEAYTGKILVKKDLPYNVNVSSSPLVTEHEVIFGTAMDGVIALDRSTLALKWKFGTGNAMMYTSPYVGNPAGNIESSPVAAGNTVFVGGADGVIYALDRQSGSLKWKHRTGAPVLSSLAISGNALFAVDFGGNVYGFASFEGLK